MYSAVIRILLRTLEIGIALRIVIVVVIGMDEAVTRRWHMLSGMWLMASSQITERGDDDDLHYALVSRGLETDRYACVTISRA